VRTAGSPKSIALFASSPLCDRCFASYQVLRYLIKACGAVLVLFGLPSTELAQCAFLIVLFFPSLQSAVERIAMEAQSSLETYVYTGQRLSMEEYEA
jgi:hypothetical protein